MNYAANPRQGAAFDRAVSVGGLPLAGYLGLAAVRAAGRAFRAIDGVLIAATDGLLAWQQRMEDRQSLRLMDDHMLKDIGISQADVEREAGKPFWRA